MDAFYSGAYPYEVSLVVSGHVVKNFGQLSFGPEFFYVDFHSYYKESAAFLKFGVGNTFRLETSFGIAQKKFEEEEGLEWAGIIRPVFHLNSFRISFPTFLRKPMKETVIYRWRVDFFPSIGFRFFY